MFDPSELPTDLVTPEKITLLWGYVKWFLTLMQPFIMLLVAILVAGLILGVIVSVFYRNDEKEDEEDYEYREL